MLLRAKNTSRPSDANPANEIGSRDFEMLHGPTTNEGACAAKSCLAVNRDGAGAGFSEMLVRGEDELFDEFIAGCGAVDEEEVLVIDAETYKAFPLVAFVVEANDLGDLPGVEDLRVLLGREANALARVAMGHGSHEGHKLARNYPVEISLVHSLVFFVLLYVERPEVVPALLQCKLKATQAVQDRALVVARALACIPVRLEMLLVVSELLIRSLSVHLQHNDHECAHQKCSIRLFVLID